MGISNSMKAVRVHGPGDYRLEEVPVPPIGPGEVLVKILATGICASDVKAFHGSRVWGGEGIEPYIQIPVTAGHEFVGEVVSLGEWTSKKSAFSIGDHVVSEQIVPCRECRFCRTGKYWMCQRHDIYGFIKDRAEGSWAEYMRFPAGAVNHKVPEEIPIEQAALIEPMACAIHAVQRGEIELGDVVAIAGMGPIGLGMLQAARKKGLGLLIALDMKPKRLALAQKFGADLTIDVSREDAVRKVVGLTDGYGCDVYIEATGSGPAITQGLSMLRRLGTFVEFSVHDKPYAVDWSIIGDIKELNIHGAHLGPYCYPLAIDYLQDGTISGADLVSHILPLEKFGEGLELVSRGEDSIKVILKP